MAHEYAKVEAVESASWWERLQVWAYWDNLYQKNNPDERPKQDDIENYFYEKRNKEWYQYYGDMRKDRARALIREARKDPHHKAKIFAYVGGLFVTLLIATASAMAVADSVVSHLALGLFKEGLTAAVAFTVVFLANVYIFRKPVADMMKRLFGFGRFREGLDRKHDSKILLDNANDKSSPTIEMEPEKNNTPAYLSSENEYKPKGKERWFYWIGLFCAAVYAFAVAALNFEKTPETMEMLGFGGDGLFALGAVLGLATFFAYFALLSLPMLKLAKEGGPKEGIVNYLSNLLGLDAKKTQGPVLFWTSRIFAGLLVIGFLGAAVWGLAMTNLTQNFSLAGLLGLTGDAEVAGIVIGMVFGTIGKLPFIFMAALNTVKLTGRVCHLAAWNMKGMYNIFVTLFWGPANVIERDDKPQVFKENSLSNAGFAILSVLGLSAFLNGSISADGATKIPGIDTKEQEQGEVPDEASIQPIIDNEDVGLGTEDKSSLIFDGADQTSRAVGAVTLFSGATVSFNSAVATIGVHEDKSEIKETKHPALNP